MHSIKEMFTARYWFLFIPLVLYVLAINPYISPGSYDDVVYWEGANSLAKHGTYMTNGNYIIDMPPGTPLLLVIPLLLGLSSIFWGKIVVIICVAVSICLAWKILKDENSPYPELAIFFFAFIPSSLLWGTRVMSEWPYILWTLLFLILIKKLDKSFVWVFLAGFVLTMATLTRYIGFTLYAVLVFQAFQKYSWRHVFKSREFFTGVLGFTLFCSTWLTHLYASNILEDSVYYRGVANFEDFSLSPVLHMLPRLFLGSTIYEAVPFFAEKLLVLMFVIPLILGWATLMIKRRVTTVDVYVIATLVVVCGFKISKDHRYLIPITPFLFSYLFFGIANIGEKFFSNRYFDYIKKSGLILLIAISFVLDLGIIFYGNGLTYGAAFYPLSNTPEKYYKGYWKDLYVASQVIKSQQASGKVLVQNTGEGRYIYFFSRQLTTLQKEEVPPTFIFIKKKGVGGIYVSNDEVHENVKVEIPRNYGLIWEGEYVALYQHNK